MTTGRKLFGGAGYRSPCPSHAKRVLYHLSYTPVVTETSEKRIMKASFSGRALTPSFGA